MKKLITILILLGLQTAYADLINMGLQCDTLTEELTIKIWPQLDPAHVDVAPAFMALSAPLSSHYFIGELREGKDGDMETSFSTLVNAQKEDIYNILGVQFNDIQEISLWNGAVTYSYFIAGHGYKMHALLQLSLKNGDVIEKDMICSRI